MYRERRVPGQSCEAGVAVEERRVWGDGDERGPGEQATQLGEVPFVAGASEYFHADRVADREVGPEETVDRSPRPSTPFWRTDGPPCYGSGHPDAYEPPAQIWGNETRVVRPIRFGDTAAPFPAYMLETVEHLDFEDFDDDLAADFGVMCVRVERAIRGLGSVGRVHVNRWGDGGSHFHVWFLGRPKGAAQAEARAGSGHSANAASRRTGNRSA